MRKIIPLILAVAVFLSMGFSSAAAQATEVGSTNVTAEYVAGAQGGQIIDVEIEWEGMDFTYNDASAAVWDAEKHLYLPASDAQWEKSNAYISITNHSNAILKAGITYNGDPAYKDMQLIFTEGNPFIGSAETQDEGEGEACKVIIRTIPVGKLTPDTPAGTKVGEIKVTVEPEARHQNVLGTIGDAYVLIPVKSDGLSRREVCFATDTALSNVAACLQTASDIINSDEYSIAQKNLALNELISAYYNALHFAQDF